MNEPIPPFSSVRSLITFACVSIAVLLGLFFLLGEEVVLDGRTRFDHTVTLDVHNWVTPQRTEIVRLITNLGAAWFVFVIYASIVLWLFWQRRFRTMIALSSIFILAELLNIGFKHLFARPRPSIVPRMGEAGGYSFPSGHMMGAVMVFGTLSIVLMHELHGRIRYLPPVVALLAVIAVGFSRIYLGVHYFTDVLGSVLVAGACLILVQLVVFLLDQPSPRASAITIESKPIRVSPRHADPSRFR